MTIKLTEDHVGTRVLLSDGAIGFVSGHQRAEPGHHSGGPILESFQVNFNYFGMLVFPPDGVIGDGEPSITLLLDAPNGMDVPVPEWCETIVGWKGKDLATARPYDGLSDADFFRKVVTEDAPACGMLVGWSPAPGQLRNLTKGNAK